MTDPQVFATDTVFKPKPDSIMDATATRLETDRHLAYGIPALSPATGRKDLSTVDIPSFNINTNCSSNWPNQNRHVELQNKWLHSDIKNVAYLFVHPLFNQIVETGDLEP